jgi:hypothetical protein
MAHIVKQLPRRSVWRPVANKLYQGGCQSYAKIACDWRLVTFKLYPSGRQLHANRPLWPPAAGKFPSFFIYFECDCRPCRYNFHATGVTWVQFVCNWRPLGCNLNATGPQSHAIFACDWRPVACKATSFRKFACAAHITFCYFELYSIF